MIPILFESTETLFSTNGIGRLADAISCVVTEERNGMYELEMDYPQSGIHYDDTADILFSLHTVIRHQLWLDGDRQYHGVDSDKPTQLGTEPLAAIRRTDVSSDELMKDMEALYADIYKCIHDLVQGRSEKNDAAVANAQHKMESLMVSTQQELRVIAYYLTNKD